MNLDDIYTPIEEAKEEIKKRWKDKELKKKVEEFLKNDIPDFLLDDPKAYLARHISSPNFEFLRFEILANEVGLDFVLSECLDDRYLSLNVHKRYLGKMFFDSGNDKNGNKIFFPQKVVDFGKNDRKTIREVDTVSGEKLVHLHHRIFSEEYPGIKDKIKDISSWLDRNGKTANCFYTNFLALFLRNGILFESFLLNKEEKRLTENVILPAVIKLKEIFGYKPLIVRLLPKDDEESSFWHYYNGSLKDCMDDKEKNNC